MSFLDTFGDDWSKDAEDDEGVEDQVAEVIEPVEPEPVEPEPSETEEKPDAPEPEEKPVHTVPYAEMKREREKRQEAERRLAEVQQQPKPQVQAPKLDAYENPEGFNQHFQSQIEQTQWAIRAELDGIRAETKYGKDVVEKAIVWGQEQGEKDPTLGLKVQRSATPVDTLVREFQQHRTLETLGGMSIEEYAQSKGWTVSQGEIPQPKPSPKTPSPSLSRRPGQGGSNQNAADAFEGVFSSDRMGIK